MRYRYCCSQHPPAGGGDCSLYSGVSASNGSIGRLLLREGELRSAKLLPGTAMGELAVLMPDAALSGRQELSRVSPRVRPRPTQPLRGLSSACSHSRQYHTDACCTSSTTYPGLQLPHTTMLQKRIQYVSHEGSVPVLTGLLPVSMRIELLQGAHSGQRASPTAAHRHLLSAADC